MRKLRTIDEAEFNSKRVLIRFDFNTPIKDGVVDDDERIIASLPTLNYIIEKDGIPVIMAHLGRPKGEVNPKYSLEPVAKRLEEIIEKKVTLLDDITSQETLAKVKKAKKGDIILLENIRFNKGEEKNDKTFASQLAKFADIYVNDAFGSAHRNHASTEGVTHFIKNCYAGFLMKKEVEALSQLRSNVKKPFVVLIGGAKISTKITVLESFLNLADVIIIGGGMAYTFLKAQGKSVGISLVEDDYIETAKSFLERAEELGKRVILPQDHVCAKEYADTDMPVYINNIDIPDDMMALDIGEKTLCQIEDALEGAKTIFWNGPFGVCEFSSFANGTLCVAKMITDIPDAYTLVGGGDSVNALNKSGLASKISHVSTGGGASLEFLEGRVFESLERLRDRRHQRKIFIGNWKMNMNKAECLDFINAVKGKCDVQNVYLAVAPSFAILDCASSALLKSGIDVFAQNMSSYEKGAYTGEVSADMLRSVNIGNVILGHSERRQLFKESSRIINEKLKMAIKEKFNVVLCVGEKLKTRENDNWKNFLRTQLSDSIEGIKAEDALEYLSIAYEPVWAIGTGKNADVAIAEETIAYIRKVISNKLGEHVASRIKILYGGSIKPENVRDYVKSENIDGALVGGASLVSDKYIEIAKNCIIEA